MALSTESIAGFSARHPWRIVGLWVAALVGSIAVIALLLSSSLTTEVSLTNGPESERADDILERWRGPTHSNEIIVVRSQDLTVDDAAFESKVRDIYERVNAISREVVLGARNFYDTHDESLVSADRHTTIVPVVMAGDEIEANDNIGEVLGIVKAAEGGDFHVLTAGRASMNDEIQEIAQHDLERGEMIGIPIALLILVLVFGALTAAVVPIVLALLSIVIAVGITAVFGQLFQFSFFVTNVITMMGLAVGIDYSLFVVSRYREERGRGRDKYAAIHAAGATASRAVFFSGMTVVFALLGMLLIPSTIFRSLGAGAIIVVMVSVGASITLLPALLGLMGDRVNSLRVPFVGRDVDRVDHEKPGGFWDAVTRLVMRYPVISFVAAAGVMVAIAVPYIDMNTGSAGVSTLPRNTEAYEGFTILRDEFNFGAVAPTEIVIHDGDITRPDVQAAIEDLKVELGRDSLYGPASFETSPDKSVGLLTVPVNADPTSDEAIGSVRELRGTLLPAAFNGTGTEVLVTGTAAHGVDYIDTVGDYTPLVFVFVLGLSFILLTIVFRSLIVPLKAIIMNMLSVGAAYGALVLFFQKGFLSSVTGFQHVDVIEAWVPLWNFSILFGLSMDYHVFLLSRIRERYNHTRQNEESVVFGVRSTAGIITGAALIMASVFGGVALGDLVMFQQMGFGLGVAVLLDATIVRSVLVPSAMKLLGDANWYLPPWLRWLPEVRTEGRSVDGPTVGGSLAPSGD
jgi:RND superfamily putative drug exporter